MDKDDALKEIYNTWVWALETARKEAQNDTQAVVVFGLALGRIGIVFERMGFDVSAAAEENNEQTD